MIRILMYIGLLLVTLTSCTTTNMLENDKSAQPLSALDSMFFYNPKYQYEVRRNDKLTISIWGMDDLSVGSTYGIYNSNEVYGKWLMVDADGNIELPKVGTYPVQGKTIIELKRALKEIYGEWVKNPVIDVKILNREITVLGEVRDPQVMTIDKERFTLMEALARCAGLEFYANIKCIKVLRQVGPDVYVANIDLSYAGNILNTNVDLLPGDIVIVPSKKYKEFDKRVSTIIPLTSTATAAALFLK